MDKDIWYRFCGRKALLGSLTLKTSFGSSVLLLLIGLAVFRAESVMHAQQAPETSSGQLTVWGGVYTDVQAKRGESLYGQECSTCHGATLSGGEAPTLSGGEFLSNWDGLTVGDLFERIRTTMPQDDPEKLTNQQYADILAFILSRNGFPAGNSEVGTHVEMLKQILIEANRPSSSKVTSGTSGEPVQNRQPASN